MSQGACLAAALMSALVGLAGCASAPAPPASHGWTPASAQAGGGVLYERPAGWLDYAAARAAYQNTNLLDLDLPLLGPLSIFYMDHGGGPGAGWQRQGAGWSEAASVETLRMGHGDVREGARCVDLCRDRSSLELAVTEAGVEGVLGLPQAQPEGMPAGDYLLRFRLADGAGGLTQTVRVEEVRCYADAAARNQGYGNYEWIYGCGSDPVMQEGDVAPMGP
jgi:hypothetical protein